METWIRSTGAHMWRSTGDIQDNWASIKSIVTSQDGREPYSGPGCYNDIDMLVVGMYGKGNVGLGGCSDVQYKSHFSLWCMMNSPLMIGCDVRSMSDATREILMNREMIAVNQDPEGRQSYMIPLGGVGDDGKYADSPVYVKPLADGGYAIGFFNLSGEAQRQSLALWDLGLPTAAGYGLKLYDLWAHKEAGIAREHITHTLDAYDCRVYRASLVRL